MPAQGRPQSAQASPVTLLLAGVINLSALAGLAIYGEIFRSHFSPAGFHVPADLYCFWANGALPSQPDGPASAKVAGLCAFMYPPPFFLLAKPLAWLAPIPAYIVWEVAANLLLLAAARAISMSWPAIGIGMLAPANLLCIAVGQNGEITSALLLLSLGLAETNPILAGIAAGCMVLKPQFALLLPVVFLAARNFRAFGAAALTSLALCLLTLLLFGPALWRHFFGVELATEHMRLDLPWHQPFQNIMVTPFVMLRSLGAGIRLANALQALITLAAFVAAARLWWHPLPPAQRPARLAATLCLVILATPFGYLYDLPGLGLAIAGFTAATQWRALLPLAVLLAFTAFYIPLSVVSFVTAPLFLLFFTLLLAARINADAIR